MISAVDAEEDEELVVDGHQEIERDPRAERDLVEPLGDDDAALALHAERVQSARRSLHLSAPAGGDRRCARVMSGTIPFMPSPLRARVRAAALLPWIGAPARGSSRARGRTPNGPSFAVGSPRTSP